MDLKDKIVIITGSGSGLGKALALKVAALGATVALVARTESELQQVKNKIVEKKGNAEYFLCDISKREEVLKMIKDIISKFKTVDILINNAGIWTMDEMEKENPALRQKALEINTLGPIQVTEEILPLFKKKNQGWIFNISSSAADVGSDISFYKAYAASKWGLAGYTKALRDDLKNTKIRVSHFLPCGFDSMLYEKAKREPSHNQPWMAKTEDIADIVVFMMTRPESVLMEQVSLRKY